MKAGRIRFTKHASEKFEFLKKYGFAVTEEYVENAITNPERVDQRDDLTLAIKSLDDEYGLGVVYRRINDNRGRNILPREKGEVQCIS